MDPQEHPFANPTIRVLIGLSGALVLVFIAFFVVEDALVRWLIVGVAAVDAVATPYILKQVVENAEEEAETAPHGVR